MDFTSVEQKWRKKWADAKVFESDPTEKKKKYITAAFPYPNSPQHIGHGRTYTTADVYARYLRMKGYNVLFPMAFHVTGTPILAMAKRIAAKDEDVLGVFERIYKIPRKKALSLTKPEDLVMHFSKEIEEGMREIGYSIDWRRKFYTFDKKFNAFIDWQFRKLHELGYLIKGEYPIAWCPSDENAVSAHDTKGDVDPELEEVTVIKFRAGEGHIVVTTYRPETVYGVTNIWVNPDVSYVKVRCNGEILYMSKEAAENIVYQRPLEIAGEIPADELLKMKAENPATKEKVPVFPATFVSASVGTGIVMSVPAHAPYDYLALRDMGKEDIRMPQVISIKGYGKNPAKEAVEKLKVKSQEDPLAEKATKEIYTKEAHEGKMVAGPYKGDQVIKAKEKISADMEKKGEAFTIMTIANAPVFCRCGTAVVVNILKDQWFIDYSNKEWKARAKECIEDMNAVPEETRGEFIYAVDWFKQKPCTRSSGLGTPFPFDETKVIEALSDSTLYMSFYTISHLLKDIPAEKMDEKFFDYVFLGKGKGSEKLDKLRESFLYWYPVDSRHSGADLVRNHLPLYILNHVAVYEKKFWPRQIVTNGFVLMDGTKMSKSIGNILPLREAIKQYGADVVRFSVVCGAELSHDTDFNRTVAEGLRSRINFLTELIEKASESRKKSRIDRWLLSRLNRKVKEAEELYDDIAMRELSLKLFYEVISELKWYEKRAPEIRLKEFFEKWVPVMAPFMPHFAEEWWAMLGNKDFVSLASFPSADERLIDDSIEMGEELIRAVHRDTEKISGLIGKKPSKVKVFVASSWKRKLYEILKEEKSFDRTMKKLAADAELKKHMKQATTVVKQLMKSVHSLPPIMEGDDELDSLADAVPFFEKEFNCSFEVVPEKDAKHSKAKNSLPGKPAIVID